MKFLIFAILSSAWKPFLMSCAGSPAFGPDLCGKTYCASGSRASNSFSSVGLAVTLSGTESARDEKSFRGTAFRLDRWNRYNVFRCRLLTTRVFGRCDPGASRFIIALSKLFTVVHFATVPELYRAMELGRAHKSPRDDTHRNISLRRNWVRPLGWTVSPPRTHS